MAAFDGVVDVGAFVISVVTHYLVSPGNTRNWSEDGVLGQLEYSPLIERMN